MYAYKVGLTQVANNCICHTFTHRRAHICVGNLRYVLSNMSNDTSIGQL